MRLGIQPFCYWILTDKSCFHDLFLKIATSIFLFFCLPLCLEFSKYSLSAPYQKSFKTCITCIQNVHKTTVQLTCYRILIQEIKFKNRNKRKLIYFKCNINRKVNSIPNDQNKFFEDFRGPSQNLIPSKSSMNVLDKLEFWMDFKWSLGARCFGSSRFQLKDIFVHVHPLLYVFLSELESR